MASHFPAGPWVRTILNFEGPEKSWTNELWWKVVGSVPSSTDVNVVAAAVDTALSDPFSAAMPDVCKYVGNDTYLNNGTYTVAAHTSVDDTGDASGAMLPNEVAAIVTASAGVGTRKGVGRIFCGGVAESSVSDSRLISEGVTLYTAIKTALLAVTTLGPVSCNYAIWSRSLAAIEKVSFITIEPILGHRRKRRPRR